VEPLGELVATELELAPAGRVPDRPEAVAELGLEALGDLVADVHRLVVPAALVGRLQQHRKGTLSLCALDLGAAWDELDGLVDADRDGLSCFHTT